MHDVPAREAVSICLAVHRSGNTTPQYTRCRNIVILILLDGISEPHTAPSRVRQRAAHGSEPLAQQEEGNGFRYYLLYYIIIQNGYIYGGLRPPFDQIVL